MKKKHEWTKLGEIWDGPFEIKKYMSEGSSHTDLRAVIPENRGGECSTYQGPVGISTLDLHTDNRSYPSRVLFCIVVLLHTNITRQKLITIYGFAYSMM